MALSSDNSEDQDYVCEVTRTREPWFVNTYLSKIPGAEYTAAGDDWEDTWKAISLPVLSLT